MAPADATPKSNDVPTPDRTARASDSGRCDASAKRAIPIEMGMM